MAHRGSPSCDNPTPPHPTQSSTRSPCRRNARHAPPVQRWRGDRHAVRPEFGTKTSRHRPWPTFLTPAAVVARTDLHDRGMHIDRGVSDEVVTTATRRQGAYAVLGAQVPAVNALQNALLMSRLLVNLSEVYEGRVRAESLLELWHHVQSTHLINDILASNRKLQAWAMKPKSEMDAPLLEFMSGIGKHVTLRRTTMYQDTIDRLLFVAERLGDLKQVRAWLPKRFVPEAAFYQLVGKPDRVIFTSPPTQLPRQA